MSSYLITGSSRGLGLSISRILVCKPSDQVSVVFASSRSRSAALDELIAANPGRIVFVQLDVSKRDSVDEAVRRIEEVVGARGLDILINNAGILNYTRGGIVNMDDLVSSFAVNVDGVQIVTSAFMPKLHQGSKKLVVNISTSLASIARVAQNGFRESPAYKVSKTALNMLTALYAQEYATHGFTFLAVNPGWCQTDMGSQEADLPVHIGANGVLAVIDEATTGDNGKFLTIKVPGWESKTNVNPYAGGQLPW